VSKTTAISPDIIGHWRAELGADVVADGSVRDDCRSNVVVACRRDSRHEFGETVRGDADLVRFNGVLD
jgi:hypothetical protein